MKKFEDSKHDTITEEVSYRDVMVEPTIMGRVIGAFSDTISKPLMKYIERCEGYIKKLEEQIAILQQ